MNRANPGGHPYAAGILLLVALPVACAALLLGTGSPSARLDEAYLDAQIERHRKGDFTVTVTGADGHPVGNARVSYRLEKHAFPFGTAISRRIFLRPPNDGDRRQYLHVLASYFNAAVHENALKWHAMEREPGVLDEQTPLMMSQWCREHGIAMRGHCIFWGIESRVQPWVKRLDKDALEAAMKARARRLLTVFGDKIKEYDLNNEMMHGDWYARRLGLDNGAAYFKWCKQTAPDGIFYVNDYDILRGRLTERYVAHIRDLLNSGAQVGGIGVQGHFGRRVPGNEELWRKLDALAQLNLPIKITEFDINTTDENQQARDLHRFYKVCFAHPAVHGVLMWGFWEGAHWRPNAALWRRNWSRKPAGDAYVSLISKHWMTQGEATTGADGRFGFRGFYGAYEVQLNGVTYGVDLTRDTTSARVVVR